jgi:hypothetical protein
MTGVLSADDRTLFVAARQRDIDALWSLIVAIDIGTGRERIVTTLQNDDLTVPPTLALNADGTMLAIRSDTGRIWTVHVDGRAFGRVLVPRRAMASLIRRGAQASPILMKWMPDGRSILVASSVDRLAATWRLVQVSSDDGRSQSDVLVASQLQSDVPIRRDIANLSSLDMMKDGSRIAFSVRGDPTYSVQRIASGLSRP